MAKKKKSKDIVSQEKQDAHGNKLIIMMSGNIFLKLMAGRKRRIGRIDREKKAFITTRKRAVHIFRKLNAYGFNEHLMNKAVSFDKVILQDELLHKVIPVSLIRNKGTNYLHFLHQGFELQRFLSLEEIEKCPDYKKIKPDVAGI